MSSETLANAEAIDGEGDENISGDCKTMHASLSYKEVIIPYTDFTMVYKIKVQTTTACEGTGEIKCNVGDVIETVVEETRIPLDPSVVVSL